MSFNHMPPLYPGQYGPGPLNFSVPGNQFPGHRFLGAQFPGMQFPGAQLPGPLFFGPQQFPPAGSNLLSSGIQRLMTRFSGGKWGGIPNAFPGAGGFPGTNFGGGLSVGNMAIPQRSFAAGKGILSAQGMGGPGNVMFPAQGPAPKMSKFGLQRLLGLIRRKNSNTGSQVGGETSTSAAGVNTASFLGFNPSGGSPGTLAGTGLNFGTRFSPGARSTMAGNSGQGNNSAGLASGVYAGTRFNPNARSRAGTNLAQGANLGQRSNIGQGSNPGQTVNPCQGATFGQGVNLGQVINLDQGGNLGQAVNPGQATFAGLNPDANPNTGMNFAPRPGVENNTTINPGADFGEGLEKRTAAKGNNISISEHPAISQGEEEVSRTLDVQEKPKYEWIGVLISRILDALENK